MQTRPFLFILLLLTQAIYCNCAVASLIGDTVIFRQAFDTGSGFVYFDESFPGFQIVEIGPITSDDTDKTPIYDIVTDPPTIDFGESGFVMEFYNVAQAYAGGFVFNGYELSSINFLPGYVITGVSVVQDFVNWDGGEPVNLFYGTPLLFTNDRVSFTDDTIYLDFQDLEFRVTGTLNFDITFAPVPVPASLWLFISGLFALISRSKKIYRV